MGQSGIWRRVACLVACLIACLLGGCPATKPLVHKDKLADKELPMWQQRHQVRLDLGGKTWVIQGLFFANKERFYLLGLQGPIKLFAARGSQRWVGGEVLFGPMRRALRGSMVAGDVWRMFLARCEGKKPREGKRNCLVWGERLEEVFSKGRVVRKRFVGCHGKVEVTYQGYRFHVLYKRWVPKRVILRKGPKYRVEVLITAVTSGAQVKTRFLLPTQATKIFPRCAKY